MGQTANLIFVVSIWMLVVFLALVTVAIAASGFWVMLLMAVPSLLLGGSMASAVTRECWGQTGSETLPSALPSTPTQSTDERCHPCHCMNCLNQSVR